MARVFKCDFCSAIVEDNNNVYDMDLTGDYYDLCESCYDKIRALQISNEE
ncbi:hypothetical protein [Metaclostridioides mangenotii]|nr:hypothetical protein [Clostridioides mangenotii]